MNALMPCIIGMYLYLYIHSQTMQVWIVCMRMYTIWDIGLYNASMDLFLFYYKYAYIHYMGCWLIQYTQHVKKHLEFQNILMRYLN